MSHGKKIEKTKAPNVITRKKRGSGCTQEKQKGWSKKKESVAVREGGSRQGSEAMSVERKEKSYTRKSKSTWWKDRRRKLLKGKENSRRGEARTERGGGRNRRRREKKLVKPS